MIDSWSIFFPDSGREGRGVSWPGTQPGTSYDSDRESRLQYAYKIDTSIVNPLANLPAVIAASVGPSLSLRTLLRGRDSCLPWVRRSRSVPSTSPRSTRSSICARGG